MKIGTLMTLGATLALLSGQAFAGAGHGAANGIGEPGKAEDVDRVIEVEMDEMSYDPKTIEVKEGETIKFVVKNVGKLVHEFNLGTEEMWDDHKDEMRTMFQKGMMTMKRLRHDKMMEHGMMHDDPNSVLLEPGDTAEVIWSFTETAEMGFACNVPGHREGGMVGKIAMDHH